jgi:hypothetical protein
MTGNAKTEAEGVHTASAGADDGALRLAFENLVATDAAIAGLHATFGDDADSREDYAELEEKRNECIATLIEVPAASMAGILAKAAALRLKVMIEDYDQHQQIAVSLADDLVCLDHQGDRLRTLQEPRRL